MACPHCLSTCGAPLIHLNLNWRHVQPVGRQNHVPSRIGPALTDTLANHAN